MHNATLFYHFNIMTMSNFSLQFLLIFLVNFEDKKENIFKLIFVSTVLALVLAITLYGNVVPLVNYHFLHITPVQTETSFGV